MVSASDTNTVLTVWVALNTIKVFPPYIKLSVLKGFDLLLDCFNCVGGLKYN